MKTTILTMTLAIFMAVGLSFNTAKANDNIATFSPGEKKVETVKVYGKCGMCKTRIEKAAKSEDGVSKAKWDQKKKELTVTYDPAVTNMEDVEKKVAGIGHDTENVRAEDKVYNNLHGCCKYDRPEKK
jgi:copper chaperone CopZ